MLDGDDAELVNQWLSEYEELAEKPSNEVERLRAAIRAHRDAKGDDRCWHDDKLLYARLGEGDLDQNALPPKCEFLASCERFFEQRQHPETKGRHPMPGEMTIRQLTDEVERLRAVLKVIAEYQGDYAGHLCEVAHQALEVK